MEEKHERTCVDKKLKMLFIHPTFVWYRVPFFRMLSQNINTKYVFTKVGMGKSVCKFDVDIKDLCDCEVQILKNNAGIAWGLIPILTKKDYDVVVPPVMDSLAECVEGIIVFVIAKLLNKKIVYYWEKWDAEEQFIPFNRKVINKLKIMLVKPFVHLADTCVASGVKSRDYFINLGVKKDKIFIAPDASEVHKSKQNFDIRQIHNIPEKKRIVLYYGRIIKQKGLHFLLHSFKKLESEINNVFLLVCGDGDFKEECEMLASELDTHNIKFVGSVPPDQREIYFSQCDIFVFPGYFYKGRVDAWGLTINEAMQFGKPVISTTAAAASYDMVKDEYNGYMIQAGDQEALYSALKKILCDPILYGEMCINARNTIMTGFTYSHMTEGFVKAVHQAIS